MRNDDEIRYFQCQIKKSKDFFENWYFTSNCDIFNNQGVPIKKNIFQDKLEILNYEKGDYMHNCIPCNLKDGANIIRYFLNSNLECDNIWFFVSIYSFLLYQQAERFGVIYSKLGFKTNKNEFDWSKFPNLQNLKYWANFFKHPKSSMYLHHPTFHIESYPDNPNLMFDGYINSEFVKTYFSGSKKNKDLEELLSNKEYKVLFPDLLILTKSICIESDVLIDKINSNKENIEILKFYRSK